MTSTVRIVTPAEVSAPYLDNYVSVNAPTSVIYKGKARIWDVSGGNISSGDLSLDTSTTNISIPWDAAAPHVDDVVEVLECPVDPELVGKAFQVVSVDGGGQSRATRRLSCIALTGNALWG